MVSLGFFLVRGVGVTECSFFNFSVGKSLPGLIKSAS